MYYTIAISNEPKTKLPKWYLKERQTLILLYAGKYLKKLETW